jgi:hypothetical protein
MKLQYELTSQDFIDFNINFIETSPVMKRSLLIQRIMFPILLLASPATLSNLFDVPFVVLMTLFGVLAILWLAFYLKWFKYRIARKSEKLIASGKVPGVVGPHELFIEQGVISDKTSTDITRYEAIEKVVESRTHIFIYVSQVMAYIVPKKVFATPSDLEAFKDLLNTFNSTVEK